MMEGVQGLYGANPEVGVGFLEEASRHLDPDVRAMAQEAAEDHDNRRGKIFNRGAGRRLRKPG